MYPLGNILNAKPTPETAAPNIKKNIKFNYKNNPNFLKLHNHPPTPPQVS